MSDIFAAAGVATKKAVKAVEAVENARAEAQRAISRVIELQEELAKANAHYRQVFRNFRSIMDKLTPMVTRLKNLQETVDNTTGITCMLAKREIEELLPEANKLEAEAKQASMECSIAMKQLEKADDACQGALIKATQLNEEVERLALLAQAAIDAANKTVEDASQSL